MDAVSGDPEDGSAFKREAAASGDEVFEPLGDAVAAVREQAMVGHADADVDGEEVHDEESADVLKRPEDGKERGDGADVEESHEDGGDPVDAALLMLAAHAEILLDLLRGAADGFERAGYFGGNFGGEGFDVVDFFLCQKAIHKGGISSVHQLLY